MDNPPAIHEIYRLQSDRGRKLDEKLQNQILSNHCQIIGKSSNYISIK